MLSQKHRTS
jgi:hypothetical protein